MLGCIATRELSYSVIGTSERLPLTFRVFLRLSFKKEWSTSPFQKVLLAVLTNSTGSQRSFLIPALVAILCKRFSSRSMLTATYECSRKSMNFSFLTVSHTLKTSGNLAPNISFKADGFAAA